MKRIAHKEVTRWVAIFIIVVAAGVGVAAQVKAFAPFSFGGRITGVYSCIADNPSGTCSACPLCSSMLGPGCNAVDEITVEGAMSSTFICPVKNFPYTGTPKQNVGVPVVGAQILGWGLSQAFIGQAGIAP